MDHARHSPISNIRVEALTILIDHINFAWWAGLPHPYNLYNMTLSKTKARSWIRSDLALLLGIAAVKLLVHLLTSEQYGYFRDEFYYLAASKRLAFGYVDFPPFIALFTALVRHTLGESLLALRLLPAIAGALVVLFTGLMARKLGASRYHQAVAALCALVAPIFLGMNSLLTMDSFDQLMWVLASYVLIGIFQDDRPKNWLVFGLIAGISLTIKVTFLYFGLALVIGLALTPWRKYFRSPWLWLGGGIALIFLLPYMIWNASHGWPTLEFWGNYGGKVLPISVLQFLLQQVILIHPVALGVWVAGLAYTFSKDGQRYRPLGWAYLLLLIIFIVQNAKNYFLAPAYPMLLALGVVAFERFIPRKSLLQWFMPAYPAVIVFGLLSAPYALPVLPAGTLVSLLKNIGGVSVKSERLDSGVLPQHFADRFGWQELAWKVGLAFQDLSEEEQAQACIFTDNYGEAGALEFFGYQKTPLKITLNLGKAYPFRPFGAYHPRIISGHNNYYLWGPGDCSGQVMIFVVSTRSRTELVNEFAEVWQKDTMNCRYCMPYEAEKAIFVCRKPRRPIEELWQGVKHFE
jgi:Dolichyl-phosphate-mannose-protein mannosyltransferase